MAITQSAQSRSEFSAAINQIATERGIDPNAVVESIQQAMIAAYRKDHELPEGEEETVTAEIDSITGEARIFDTKSGKKTDITPAGFGRIAAQTAKQVILQKVREAEKSSIIADFTTKVGSIVQGMVLRFDGKNVILDLGRGQGFMPPEEQMRNEYYRINQRVTVYVKEIRETMRGKTIIVSRAAKELVKELFAREVPEVSSNAVEIAAIAREAGVRTKMAVKSTQEGVDPVGSCVGQKGIRVQEVIKELNNEKIDIIPFTENTKDYLQAALAPAEHLEIDVNTTTNLVTVTAPDDQLSLAIGRDGQNVRLAAKLTGFKITIKSQSGKQSASATGKEEYEIDQLELDEQARAALVEKGYTTFFTIREHVEELKQMEHVGEAVVEQIKAKLALLEPKKTEEAPVQA